MVVRAQPLGGPIAVLSGVIQQGKYSSLPGQDAGEACESLPVDNAGAIVFDMEEGKGRAGKGEIQDVG